MKRMINYWTVPVFSTETAVGKEQNYVRLLVMSALLAALAAIFQSAGGLLPGVGYIVSPLATLPVAVAALLSVGSGVSTYIVTIGLLLLLQPGELFIFPFTTGVLGLAIGLSLRLFRRRSAAVIIGGSALFLGILFLVLLLQFPLFGPDTATSPGLLVICLVFSVIYSWIWTEAVLFFKQRIPFFRH